MKIFLLCLILSLAFAEGFVHSASEKANLPGKFHGITTQMAEHANVQSVPGKRNLMAVGDFEVEKTCAVLTQELVHNILTEATKIIDMMNTDIPVDINYIINLALTYYPSIEKTFEVCFFSS